MVTEKELVANLGETMGIIVKMFGWDGIESKISQYSSLLHKTKGYYTVKEVMDNINNIEYFDLDNCILVTQDKGFGIYSK